MIMNAERTYRDLIVSTVAIVNERYQDLLHLGMNLVSYEDVKDGFFPFETGDMIPIYIEVFEASDIPAVQAIAHALPTIREIIFSLRSLNNITEEEIESMYETDENDISLKHGARELKEVTWTSLKSDVYVCLSEMVFFINSNTYWMKYGHEQPDDSEHDFFMPEPETYALLATDDTNFQPLIRLSKYLNMHRESVWSTT